MRALTNLIFTDIYIDNSWGKRKNLPLEALNKRYVIIVVVVSVTGCHA